MHTRNNLRYRYYRFIIRKTSFMNILVCGMIKEEGGDYKCQIIINK